MGAHGICAFHPYRLCSSFRALGRGLGELVAAAVLLVLVLVFVLVLVLVFVLVLVLVLALVLVLVIALLLFVLRFLRCRFLDTRTGQITMHTCASSITAATWIGNGKVHALISNNK